MNSNLKEMGRVAFREEGDKWNAYYAMPDTMKGSLYLGALNIDLARNPALKHAFMDLMRHVVSVMLEEVVGEKPIWKEPIDAPAHERKK